MLWRGRTPRPFWLWLAVWTAIGLIIRVATVYGHPGRQAGGDPYAYFYGARLLVTGHGFIDPYAYLIYHQVVQSAAYAPLYMLTLAAPMLVGLKTFFVARLWTCIVSAAAVTMIGLTGREIAGRRAGLIAAALTAVYPNLWMPDEMVAAEALIPLLLGTVLFCAYRFWKQPDVRRAIWFGLSIGVLVLGRDELALLFVFMFVPLVLLAKLAWKRRLRLLAVGALSAVVVIGPWVGYNLTRFQKATFVSNEAGLTMASADCDATFYGPAIGYWSMPCAVGAPVQYHGDQSVENAAYQKYVYSYLRHHESRIPFVTLAKIGRAFALYRPMQQITLDSTIETRPHHWALTGLYAYYALLGLSVVGCVVLRKRHVPIFPLLVVGLNVVLAVAVAFGNTRYRIPFEVSLVLLSSVALDAAWTRLKGGRDAAQGTAEVAPSDSRPTEPASLAF
jgi:hypothetical protein